MNCRLCGRATQLLFAARDHARPQDGTVYELQWCDACEFGRIAGNFSPERVRDFYRRTTRTEPRARPERKPA
jgi:hypothetical protein